MNPLLVGFGSLYPELQLISDLTGVLGQAGRRFPIVIGGQMVSPIPEFAIKITGADFGVIGKGEVTSSNNAKGRVPRACPWVSTIKKC